MKEYNWDYFISDVTEHLQAEGYGAIPYDFVWFVIKIVWDMILYYLKESVDILLTNFYCYNTYNFKSMLFSFANTLCLTKGYFYKIKDPFPSKYKRTEAFQTFIKEGLFVKHNRSMTTKDFNLIQNDLKLFYQEGNEKRKPPVVKTIHEFLEAFETKIITYSVYQKNIFTIFTKYKPYFFQYNYKVENSCDEKNFKTEIDKSNFFGKNISFFYKDLKMYSAKKYLFMEKVKEFVLNKNHPLFKCFDYGGKNVFGYIKKELQKFAN